MKVLWSAPAVEDLESIRDYIAKDSDYHANSFVEKIIYAVEKLDNFPMLGRVIPEVNNPKLRELIFQNFRIMYRIHLDTIQVIAIIRGSRDLNNWPVKPWEII